jgi:hypothetical protein
MKNYKYRVDGEDIIVSPKENDRIKAEIKAGRSMVYLRNDELAINVNFIRYIKETEQATDVEEKMSEERLKLNAPTWQEPTAEEIENRKMILDSYKNTIGVPKGASMKECKRCKETHFIPNHRDFCLPCLVKNTREKKTNDKTIPVSPL